MSIEALAGPDEAGTEEPVAGVPGSVAGTDRAGDAVTGDSVPAGSPIGVRLLDGGIIEVVLPANHEIQGPEVRVAVEAVRALAQGRHAPVLLVLAGVVGVSVAARQVYAASIIEASAFALVAKNPVDRVIAHYLLRSRSEKIPADFFTSEADAVEWLGRYASDD